MINRKGGVSNEEVCLNQFMEFVNHLNVVGYNYKTDPEDTPRRIGMIAQDVQTADPELAKFFVTEDETGMPGLKSADLVFPPIAAVQYLSQEVEELRQQIQKQHYMVGAAFGWPSSSFSFAAEQFRENCTRLCERETYVVSLFSLNVRTSRPTHINSG